MNLRARAREFEAGWHLCSQVLRKCSRFKIRAQEAELGAVDRPSPSLGWPQARPELRQQGVRLKETEANEEQGRAGGRRMSS